ncbi:MAG TPA: GGDEF domain-containing protein [Gammaproteobacteria bacterium]|nr:GGDEF domain-containing protein [Gammaproteobacteria bacterium]
MTRAQTLTLALLTLHLLIGVLCLAVARGERASPALRLWGWALLAFGFGALFTLLVTVLPLALRQVAGNTIISLSAVLSGNALLHHARRRIPLPWAAAGVGACFLGLVGNHVLDFGLAVDIAIPTLFATVIYVTAIVHLLRTPSAAARPAILFLCGVLIFTVIVWNTRLIAIAHVIGGSWERDRADLIVSLFAIAQLMCLVAATLALVWIEVRNMGWELERMALTDPLTGLPNRRAMLARFEEERARAARTGRSFAIALFDADHFKRINDTYGHLAGDAVLRAVAAALARTRRASDGLGRIGGEEFLVVMSDLDRAAALEVAMRLHAAVGATRLEQPGGALQVTVSGGLAFYPQEGDSWDALYSVADRRLYRAKREGRNRIIADDGSSD